MFIGRSLHLYRISLASVWHRIQHDFARELVVAICAAVILATFGYIFNDFLNVKINELSPAMRSAFARASAVFGLGLSTTAAIRLIRLARYDQNSLGDVALRMGELPRAVAVFTWLRAVTILIVVYGVTWALIFKYLVQWPIQLCLLIQLGLLALVAAAQLLPRPKDDRNKTIVPLIPPNWQHSRLATMVKWRLIQIVRRNRLTQACLVLALLINLFAAALAIMAAPMVATIFVCMVAGVFGSMAMAFQLQEDLENAWAERCLGVDHDCFERTYTVIGSILGLVIGLVPALAVVLAHQDLQGLSTAGKALIITWIPFFAMPSMMFQIDGRRPAIQAVLVTIATLILSTAVLASWFALIILPIFRYYVSGVQQGRFYRA